MAERILSKERRALIADWRKHRFELLRLAMELDGWEHVTDYLNGFLEMGDMVSHVQALGFDPVEFAETFLGERDKSHSSEPLSPDQR